MKNLNSKATEIFSQLLNMLNGDQHLKIGNREFMPLTIERISFEITSFYGTGKLYSLCHYYKQNSDLMQDPEMVFIVIDKRNGDLENFQQLYIYPTLYQQAALGLYQESVTIRDGKVLSFDLKKQMAHVDFANSWLRNIKKQGFLKMKS